MNNRLRARATWRGLAVGTAVLLMLGVAVPASAHNGLTPRFTEIDQVSDQPGKARITDASLVNAWGLALSPTSPLWVADNGADTSTVTPAGSAAPPSASRR